MNHNGLMLETALWVRGAIKEHTVERKQETKYLFKDFVLNNAMGFLNSTFFDTSGCLSSDCFFVKNLFLRKSYL